MPRDDTPPLQHLHPKLRQVSNGSEPVNQLRAQYSQCVVTRKPALPEPASAG